MKIFVVGPESTDFFAHNVAYTCRTLGHEVSSDAKFLSLAAKGRVRVAVEENLSKLSAWRRRQDQRIVDVIVEAKPALTIVCTKTLEPELVQAIRSKTGSRVICWFGDTPGNVKRNHVVSGEYDAVFVKDKRFAADLRNVLGINAFHLHEACNPAWHRPTTTERMGHLAVAGTLYGYRVAVIKALLRAGWPLECFGPPPSPWVDREVAALHTGRFLDHTNKATEFGRALACLNTFAPAERNALNCRIFETCGSGGLLVSEHKSAMDECFDAYEEYLPFSSADELLEQLSRAQKDRAMVERVRANGAKRAHADHSYAARVSFILKALA